MIVALGDELLHLGDGILPALGHVLGDIGDLGPDHHAPLVAEVIEVLVMLIMGQADGVGAHFADDVHILLMLLAGDGVAQALPVLMAAHAPQGVLFAVEVEAGLGVIVEVPHAEAAADLIPGSKTGPAGVEVGILHAVPEMDVLDDKGLLAALAPGHLFALVVQQGHGDGLLGVLEGLDRDLALGVALQGLCRDHQAIAAEVVQIKVLFGHDQQLHVPVDAAVEGEVRLLGVDPVVGRVGNGDLQQVFILQQLGHIRAEGGVAALVAHDLLPVQRDLALGVHAVELEIHPLLFLESGLGDLLFIFAAAALVVVSAVLAVDGVPGMGDVDLAHRALGPGKAPGAVQVDTGTHVFLRLNHTPAGSLREYEYT